MSNYNDDRPVVEQNYVPPVAEAVVEQPSFWSRFWWILPLLALLIALPFILRGCNRETVVEPAPVVPAPVETAPAVTTPEPVTTLPATIDQCEGVTGTINFRWWGGDGRAEMQQRAIEAFQEKYPGVTFNTMPVAFSGYWDQLTVEAAGGNLPDVFTSNVEWLSSLAPEGLLANLSASPYVDLTPISDSLSEVTFNGNVYAVPTGLNAASLLVNYDILDEAGIAHPDENWTWDDLARIAQEVSAAGLTNSAGEPVFGVAHLGGQQVARIWANQTDGGIFDANGNVNWSEGSMENYLALVQNMIADGGAPSAAEQVEFGTTAPGESMMALGRAAFQPQWSNQLAAASPSDANIGLIRFPGDFASAHIGTWLRPSMTFAVAANAQSPEAAECFVNFMVNAPEAAEIMGIDRGIPMNPAIFDLVVPNLTGTDAAQAAFIDEIAARPGVSVPMPPLNDDLNNVLSLSTESAMFGNETPAAAAGSLRSALQNALAN